jgi:hypothetical protein
MCWHILANLPQAFLEVARVSRDVEGGQNRFLAGKPGIGDGLV